MSTSERVIERLNQALHHLFATDPAVLFLGEDVLDPYGGAFRASKGLSSAYPDRVFTTPISEQAIVGIAAGLALCGNKPIVEIMFGDFITLAYDQIINFASKSVAMYGSRLKLPLLVRCPVGGNRGYGPTHSQSVQKYFVGVPYLHLFEISPYHDLEALLTYALGLGNPAILFEDKGTYSQRTFHDGTIDDLFAYRFLDAEQRIVQVYSPEFDTCDCVILAPGGLSSRCLAAARTAFIDHEITTQIIIPAQLYPLELEPMLDVLHSAEQILIVEESVGGGTWGSEVASLLYTRMWGELKRPIRQVHSKSTIIPSSPHLEKQVLVQSADIYAALKASFIHA